MRWPLPHKDFPFKENMPPVGLIRNYDTESGRSDRMMRYFKLSQHGVREHARELMIPGLIKHSW